MKITPEHFAEIAKTIHSDSSPVGIDAKKTHVLILAQLKSIQKDLRVIKEHLGL